MSDQPTLTTAGALNRFAAELFDGDYSTSEQIGHLATIALHALVSDGQSPIVREAVAQ